MLATMLIWREGDDYLLQLPRALCEPIRKKLTMYVLRAKVKISDASDEIVISGIVRCRMRRKFCARDSANCRKRRSASSATHKAA